MLGLYDSGLGGLTVLRALRKAGVDQDVVYFADQAHVPYGGRSDDDLYALLAENFALLETYDIEAVVMACNTSCAVASRMNGFPRTRFAVLDLIANAGEGLKYSGFEHIAVFATVATVRSGAYARAIRSVLPRAAVTEIAAPELVPLVEAGAAGSPEAAAAVRGLCARLPGGIDAIVYGCTHYPLLDAEFAAALGQETTRFDPAVAQAEAAAGLVRDLNLPRGRGTTQYLTNGDLDAFERNVRRWTNDRTGTVARATALAS